MIFHPKTGLSYKIVGSLVLIFVLILTVLGMIVRIVFEETIEVSEKQKADLVLQTIEKPLQMALYLKFYDQIEEKVLPAVAIPDVLEIVVRDHNEQELYYYRSKKQLPSAGHEALSVTREIHEPTGGALMGSVALRYSDLSYDETRR